MCALCLVQVPCACSIQADTIYFPSSLQACKNVNGESKVYHPINILALTELSKEAHNSPQSVWSNDTFQLNISQIPFYKSSYIDDEEEARAAAIGIKSLTNQMARKGDRYFLSHIDYLDSRLANMSPVLDKTSSISLFTIIFVLAFAGLTIATRLHYKYRTLIRMVSMIEVPCAVDSAPTFLLGNNAEGYPIFQHWEYYVMVILLILLVVQAVHLIVKLLSYMARNSVLFSPFSAI